MICMISVRVSTSRSPIPTCRSCLWHVEIDAVDRAHDRAGFVSRRAEMLDQAAVGGSGFPRRAVLPGGAMLSWITFI